MTRKGHEEQLARNEKLVRTWNGFHPVGTRVRYALAHGEESPVREGATLEPASLLRDGTPVVRIEGAAGPIALAYVRIARDESGEGDR